MGLSVTGQCATLRLAEAEIEHTHITACELRLIFMYLLGGCGPATTRLILVEGARPLNLLEAAATFSISVSTIPPPLSKVEGGGGGHK